MAVVHLDLKTLLGFKIVESSTSPATRRAAKIGGKACATSAVAAAIVQRMPISAKIGTKTGAKTA